MLNGFCSVSSSWPAWGSIKFIEHDGGSILFPNAVELTSDFAEGAGFFEIGSRLECFQDEFCG